jgi:nicotinate-nucleotide pyrophosphorylase (carboxylating)
MDDAMLAEAVRAVRAATPSGGHCVTEASGRVTFERLPALAASGVDRVSTSKLTMASPVDVAFDLEDPGE